MRVDLATGKTTRARRQRAGRRRRRSGSSPSTFTPQAYIGQLSQARDHRAQSGGQEGCGPCSTKELGDGFDVTNRTLDDTFWTVVDRRRAGAGVHLSIRPQGRQGHQAVRSAPGARARRRWCPCRSLELKARDGLTLVSYLSLPPGSDANGDGVPDIAGAAGAQRARRPVGRDTYGFDNEHQWLANRGYAVLSVNFRASTGFGKSIRQRRQQGVGRQDARRPARRHRLGGEAEDHHRGQGRDLRRLVRRLRHARRRHVHARYLRLRRRHRRSDRTSTPC